MADDIEITFTDDGDMQAVYSDALAELFAGERMETRRASHVEPHPKGGWLADMRPVGGPVLCADGSAGRTGINHVKRLAGFPTRQAALDAEVAWLRERMAAGTVEAKP